MDTINRKSFDALFTDRTANAKQIGDGLATSSDGAKEARAYISNVKQNKRDQIKAKDFNALFLDPVRNKDAIGDGLMILARIVISKTNVSDRFKEDAEMEVVLHLWKTVSKVNPGDQPFGYLLLCGKRHAWRFAQKQLRNDNREPTNSLNGNGEGVETDASGEEVPLISTPYTDLPRPPLANRLASPTPEDAIKDALRRASGSLRRMDDEDPHREFIAGMVAMARMLTRRIAPKPAKAAKENIASLEAEELAGMAEDLLATA